MKQKILNEAKNEILKSFNDFVRNNCPAVFELSFDEVFQVRSAIIGNFGKLRDIVEEENRKKKKKKG